MSLHTIKPEKHGILLTEMEQISIAHLTRTLSSSSFRAYFNIEKNNLWYTERSSTLYELTIHIIDAWSNQHDITCMNYRHGENCGYNPSMVELI